MGYVFISYSSKNKDIADSIKNILSSNQIDTWMAPYDIPAGFEYAQVINDAIENCSCFILLLTDHAQASNWVPREVERAVNFSKKIIPVQLGPVTLNSDFQLYISVNHAVTIDEAKDFFSEMKKVLTSIKMPVSSGRNRYQPGNTVGGKYEILEHLEQGLCYDVFVSRDLQTKQQWIARAIYKDGESSCASWVQAVTLNKKLDHPLLARIVDVLDEEDHILVVMEYVEGTPLSMAIQERSPIPEEQIRDWGIQIADLLNYLHRQDPAFSQIHLWPSQFLLTPSGDIKMRYFTGIQEENALLIKSRPSVFIAPEESSHSKADPRTDIYAFGYLLYSILTGRDFSKPPYAVLPLRSARPDLSGAMEHIVRKCIELNPRDRYQSAGELLKDLKNMDKRSNPSFFQRLLHSFERKQP